MKIKQCDECKAYCLTTVAPCPTCGGSNFSYLSDAESAVIPENEIISDNFGYSTLKQSRERAHVEQPSSEFTGYFSMNKGNEASNAIGSARIVDGYGEIVQIVGIVLGVLTLIGYTWIGSQLNYGFAGFIVGLIAGSITAGVAIVNGALLRMISNYVIAKLKA
jgi:hypothetical protein